MKQRKTKIVCTIGPASSSRKMLKKLILAGMNVARLNFSHGTHEEHRKVFERIRSLAKSLNRPVGVMQDLQGPKIRTGKIKGGSLVLKAGEEFVITSRRILGEPGIVSTTYGGIIKDLDKGHAILIDDGLMELKVLGKNKTNLTCKVVTGGILHESKGINLPGVKTRIPSLTKKDKEDLRAGIEMGIDYVAISFVRSAKDVKSLKRELKRLGADVPVIAKIEKPQALEELDEILDACEGIMVARGDLGVELSPEKVPIAQKMMIRKANLKRKLVITATQMLESMTEHPIPTRAEASDVANAILDGTDVVMLSGETSVGRYPVKTVQMMERIAIQAETDYSAEGHSYPKTSSFPDAISESACLAAENLGLKSI
ncbi:MAG TPA: pyruvate kinase, partial [Deltaproteobacteria bacterium]|nr:pyruvate kinase [Deltaproteobacteria bacterium]